MAKINRRSFLKGAAVAGAVASIGFPSIVRNAKAAATVLKFGTYEPAQAFLPVKVFKPWVEKVNAVNPDVLKIDLYTNGQLGPDPTQQLKMIIDGMADITSSGTAYAPGRFPETMVTNVPFITNNMLEASIACHYMHEKNMWSGFGDIMALCMTAQPTYYLHSTQPIRTPADMKGKKIRTAGKMQQDLVTAAGGTPVAESISKVAENISRGVMDGTVGEWQGMDTFRVVDVATCHTYVPFGTNTFPILMSKRSFDKLPAAAQQIIMDNSGMDLLVFYAKEWDSFNDGVEARLRADPKHTHIDMDEELSALWNERLDAATQGWLKTNPKFPNVLETYKQCVADARKYIAEKGI